MPPEAKCLARDDPRNDVAFQKFAGKVVHTKEKQHRFMLQFHGVQGTRSVYHDGILSSEDQRYAVTPSTEPKKNRYADIYRAEIVDARS